MKLRLNGLNVLAIFLITLGLLGSGLLSVLTVVQLWSHSFSGLVDNPVYLNTQRLTTESSIVELKNNLQGNFAQIGAFTGLVIFLTIHYASILRLAYRCSPLSIIIASFFLGGSLVLGVLIGSALVLVSTFAFQVTLSSPHQQEWLQTGLPFLIQIHLIYVYGWFFCTALGWFAFSFSVMKVKGWIRYFGRAKLLASLIILVSLTIRAWLPLYGEQAPVFVVVIGRLFGIGMGLGLLASGFLYLLLENDRVNSRSHNESKPAYKM